MKKGILYICIQKKLGERAGFNRIISRDNLFRILGETFHVPKKIRPVVLKEMIHQDMVSPFGKDNLKINKLKFDPEERISEVYASFGFY